MYKISSTMWKNHCPDETGQMVMHKGLQQALFPPHQSQLQVTTSTRLSKNYAPQFPFFNGEDPFVVVLGSQEHFKQNGVKYFIVLHEDLQKRLLFERRYHCQRHLNLSKDRKRKLMMSHQTQR